MKRGWIFGVLLIILLSGLVVASLYAEKIPDPERFISIQPIWSALLETELGKTLKVSFIEFVWIDDPITGRTGETQMAYLNDGENEHIAEKMHLEYAIDSQGIGTGCPSYREDARICQTVCSDTYMEKMENDEIWITNVKEHKECKNDCTRQYNCGYIVTWSYLGPDGYAGITSIDVDFGEIGGQFSLNFDPVAGKLTAKDSSYNGESFDVIKQEGYLSADTFRAK